MSGRDGGGPLERPAVAMDYLRLDLYKSMGLGAHVIAAQI